MQAAQLATPQVWPVVTAVHVLSRELITKSALHAPSHFPLPLVAHPELAPVIAQLASHWTHSPPLRLCPLVASQERQVFQAEQVTHFFDGLQAIHTPWVYEPA